MFTRHTLLRAGAACFALGLASAPAQLATSNPRDLMLAQVSAASASPSPEPTAAPSVNQDGTAEAERVIVTGSHIPVPTAGEVGPNPVQLIDRDTIDKSAARNIEELLRDQPVANANGVPTSGQPGAVYGQGASSISLRGFDPGATLVLIDGHRVVSHPSGSSGGAQFFVDLNSIPRGAVESVEILKDGASTTYGADAVAGVVNIKLRHDYRGAEIFSEYGNTTNRDSGELSDWLLFGTGNNTTNITGVVNYYSRNSIFKRDRDYDRNDPRGLESTNSSPYNLELSRAAVIAAGGNPDPSLGATFFGHAPFFSNGTAPASDYVYTPGPSVLFPVNRYSGELPDTERYGGYVSADHKVFGDQMVAYADLFAQRSDVHNEQAPVNTTSFQLNGATTIAIPAHAPGATLGGPTYAETGLPLNAYNPFNPFQQIISGDSRARLFEFGNREYDNRTDSIFTTLGLRGDKLFNGTWGYDAAFRYSYIEAPITFTIPSTKRFQRVLNAADPIFDPSSPQYIGTTIPFNPFGDYRRSIGNNYKLANFVVIHPQEIDTGSLTEFDLNIYTTDLFQLPAGGVGLAFGAQFHHESERQDPDPAMLSGDLRPFGIFFPVDASRDSYAGYAETSIPIFGSANSAPGFHALEFTAAVRYETFSEGTNVMVPKFGLRWQPLDDSLTIRATWGEGYRLPTTTELTAPPVSLAVSLFDPRTQQFANDVPTTFLANPDLQPEDSRNFTAGVVYSPKFAPGLTVSVDLFDIETTGYVNADPDQTLAVQRIENGGALPGESVVRDTNGNLVSITEVGYLNSGSQKARGADFGVDYELSTSFGTLRSTTQATYLDSFQFSPFPGVKEQELRSSGTDFFSHDAYLKWKANSRLEWIWNGVTTSVATRYHDGFHEISALGFEHYVKQTWLFDLQASYDFTALTKTEEKPVAGYSKTSGETGKDGATAESAAGQTLNSAFWRSRWGLKGLSVTVGCNNVFDHDPPQSVDNFPRFIYDPTGRFIYASVKKQF